jgi:S1-C subfamily serine protease
MTGLDWIVVLLVALAALAGARRGLLVSALSLAGVVGGGILGARIVPTLFSRGAHSPYTPLAALGGAVFVAAILETLGTVAGIGLRHRLRLKTLRELDMAGGLAFGAVTGLALAWVAGAVILLIPGQTNLRRDAQRSVVLRRLNELVSPRSVLNALARVDPFPSIVGPAPPARPPDPRVLAEPGVRRAAPSVVRVLGSACGLSVEGSGWVARAGLVVTAAHVVAGEDDTTVQVRGTGTALAATAVAFDPHNDVAVLRVRGLDAPPLALANPRPGARVAILGYPENGPFDARPARMGLTAGVISSDAYGNGPVTRTITSVRGLVRHGNSGGPAVDARGRVEATIFAARGSDVGYGVPAEIVRRDLAKARRPVSTGSCAS